MALFPSNFIEFRNPLSDCGSNSRRHVPSESTDTDLHLSDVEKEIPRHKRGGPELPSAIQLPANFKDFGLVEIPFTFNAAFVTTLDLSGNKLRSIGCYYCTCPEPGSLNSQKHISFDSETLCYENLPALSPSQYTDLDIEDSLSLKSQGSSGNFLLGQQSLENMLHIESVRIPGSKKQSFSFQVPDDYPLARHPKCKCHGVPSYLSHFVNLHHLNVSSNGLRVIGEEIASLSHLRTLTAIDNQLSEDGFWCYSFAPLKELVEVNLSGNAFKHIPAALIAAPRLARLYMGANHVQMVTPLIARASRLEILYLGGNRLGTVPKEIGLLRNLQVLVLGDNQLTSIPRELGLLNNLRRLDLHQNRLRTLPIEIVQLELQELSLRNNPLIAKFARECDLFEPPSLRELAGRALRSANLEYHIEGLLPTSVVAYLDSAHECVNPKCQGVYFTSCVSTVKFVDFCGKYRVPFLQYLCSPQCQPLSTRARLRSRPRSQANFSLLSSCESNSSCSSPPSPSRSARHPFTARRFGTGPRAGAGAGFGLGHGAGPLTLSTTDSDSERDPEFVPSDFELIQPAPVSSHSRKMSSQTQSLGQGPGLGVGASDSSSVGAGNLHSQTSSLSLSLASGVQPVNVAANAIPSFNMEVEADADEEDADEAELNERIRKVLLPQDLNESDYF